MGVEQQIWRISDDDRPTSLTVGGIDFEKRLENILEADISLLSSDWMVIGRQCDTPYGKYVDLLAMDGFGNLIVMELKRNQTPREVVAQVLEYGQWVKSLGDDDLAEIFEKYQSRQGVSSGPSLDEAFMQHFGRAIPGELNSSHQLVVVAAYLDPQSERIVEYLAETYGVQINVVFFKVFQDEGHEYLSRAWMSQPSAALSEEPKTAATRGAWNGETYISFGRPREFVNAGLKYGFISAGGGGWYSRGLSTLKKGERVWVNRVGGYVGVGRVVSEAPLPADDFTVNVDGMLTPVTQLDLGSYGLRTMAVEGADAADYFVEIDWTKTVDFDSAVSEKGFFGNQNTVSRPVTPSWQHTIERLKARWGVT